MPHRAEPLTIVCVDDDLPLLRSLREQLQRGLGRACEIELAAGGEEALALIDDLVAEGVRVPLVISDHLMAGMRGTDLLARVHQRHPQILTVLLTGQADAAAVGQAVNDAKLYRFLSKPWQESDLILTVREALRRADQESVLAQRSAELAASNTHLEHSLQLLQATMDATLDALLVIGRDGLPVQVNQQFLDLWAVPPSLAHVEAGHGLLDHVRAQWRDPADTPLDRREDTGATRVADLRDGRAIEVAARAYRLGGERAGTVYSFRDVTERECSARVIRHQAMHDSLSGLPNRLHFTEALEAAIAQARQRQDCLAVMFVDLDHFKRVNDTLGHDAGDELLRGVAARLAQSLREGDLIARWGGDEFTVLVPRMRCSGEVGTLARRVIEALQPPFEIGGLQLRVSASVGVASWPDDGEDGPSLLRRADMALYRAKEEGRNGYHCYRASDFAGLDDGLSLETALQRAVAEGGLQLHYQPQVDTRSGRICSVEALARWHHPERGWISPAVFIPLAERTGDILALGAWVLRTACAQAAAWRAAGLGDFSVAVNISPAQFERSDLPALVAEVLEDTGLAPEALEIEVTESVAVRRVGETAQALRTLQSRGVRIALDDFGTGYASLAAFKDLPCDTLKIDRSFIAGLERAGADRGGSKDAAIVRALQALAEGLGLRLVAEGVETAAVTTALQGLGCWTHQGYWLHRPMPAAELEKVLRGTRTTPAPLASSAGEGHLGRPAGEPARPARASLPG